MKQLIDVQAPAELLNAASAGESWKIGVKNALGDDPAEMLLYGVVGDGYEGVTARNVSEFLRSNRGKQVHVRINSPGGLAYDGITIHNALLQHDGPVTTTIEGLAGSAASVVAMAGRPVRMFENADFFIHRALALAIGNEAVMEDVAEMLRKLDVAIAKTYAAKTGKAYTQMLPLMKGKIDGTNFTAKEAKAMGFVDEIVPLRGDRAQAEADVSPVAESLHGEAVNRLRSVEALRARRVRERRDLYSQGAS